MSRYIYRCDRQDGERPHWIGTTDELSECIAYVHGEPCGAKLVQRGGPRRKKNKENQK